MPILPRRYKRLTTVLNRRMTDLTLLLEKVEKPHNLSAILRSCDAVGILEAHAIYSQNHIPTYNTTAQGSQKWVKLNTYSNIENAIERLKRNGFKLYGTTLDKNSTDYRNCDFTGKTAFVLGAEKWGLSKETMNLMDKSIFVPMRGMVQSLNVSVAAATLLFEALRQREEKNILPTNGESLSPELYKKIIFEWAYPEVANWCKQKDKEYPVLDENGKIMEDLPRKEKFFC